MKIGCLVIWILKNKILRMIFVIVLIVLIYRPQSTFCDPALTPSLLFHHCVHYCVNLTQPSSTIPCLLAKVKRLICQLQYSIWPDSADSGIMGVKLTLHTYAQYSEIKQRGGGDAVCFMYISKPLCGSFSGLYWAMDVSSQRRIILRL